MKISIVPFFATHSAYRPAAEQMYSMALTDFISSQKAIFVEREGFSHIEAEKIFQANDDVAMGEAIAFDRSIGATHILLGKVSRCETEYNRPDVGNPYYTCQLETVIRLVNIETGQIEVVENWRSGGLTCLNTAKTKEKSVAKTVRCSRRHVKKFIRNFLQQDGTIKQFKYNGEVIVSLGEEDGISRGTRMKVFSVTDIDGEDFIEEIGEIKVMTLNGPHLSTAKILRGTDAIREGVNQQVQLLIKPRR